MASSESKTSGYFSLDEKRFLNGYRLSAGEEILVIGGQVGLDSSGTMGADFAAQVDSACANLIAVLHGADMGVTDLIALRWFVVLRDVESVTQERLTVLKSARQEAQRKHLAALKCVTTLIFVPCLYRVDCLVEVEGMAARAR